MELPSTEIFPAIAMTARHAAATNGVPAMPPYVLHQPLLPSWRRLRRLFGHGSDLSVLRALEYELLDQAPFAGRVLDFGGGSNANYGEHMQRWMRGCEYETANIDAGMRPTYLIEPGHSLPIPDDRYDTIVTLNTLEHIFEIDASLRELLRVLVPGGQLVATVPFLFRIHGHPDDFLRGTPSWWGRVLSTIGFTEIEITPLLWGPFSTGVSLSGIPGPFKQWRMRGALLLDVLYARRRCRGHTHYTGELARAVSSSPLGFLISARKPQGILGNVVNEPASINEPLRHDLHGGVATQHEPVAPPEPTFSSFFFGSSFGYLTYHLLRNDWVWSRMSEEEKRFVKIHNEYWNNNAEGYKKPAAYKGQGGQSFNTVSNRLSAWKGRRIEDFLQKFRPRRVLEIGPGSGYYSRQIIDKSFVEEYVAADINSGFLDFIESGIREHPRRSLVKFERAAISEMRDIAQVDAIVVLSTLHHIPDRPEFVSGLARLLKPGGAIFFYEPTHSLLRVLRLLFLFGKYGWYKTDTVRRRNNYMTHHFCTISETRRIAQTTGLDLVDLRLKGLFPFVHIAGIRGGLSKEMTFILKKEDLK